MAAFVDRVRQRFQISAAEEAFLNELQANPARVRRGQTIAASGEPAAEAFVLLTGWAMSHSRFPDGVQVRRLHFPGDLLAMPSVAMRHHAEDIEALSDAVISRFPKQLLARLFTIPRLTAIMYMLAQAERITAGDRLANLGRNSAKGRVAYLLLDILNRLRATDSQMCASFYMHLKREQVAQFTGMTTVHASRMWSALIEEGYFSCTGHLVTILDEAGLVRLSNYRDLDADFDRRWLKTVETEVASSGHRAPIQG